MKRVHYLDGLRGTAALVVVVAHYALAFLPSQGAAALASGADCAVALFFLISGFVLTTSFERSPTALASGCGRRLIRLGWPLLVAVVGATILQLGLPDWAKAAAERSGSAWLFGNLMPDDQRRLLLEATGITMLSGYSDTTLFGWMAPRLLSLGGSADLPIWSLNVEFWGSLLILAAVWARSKGKLAHASVVFALAILGCSSSLLLFVIGHVSALAVRTDWYERYESHRVTMLTAVLTLLAGVALCSLHQAPVLGRLSVFADHLTPLRPHSWFSWNTQIGAIMIYGGILAMPAAHRILEMRWALSLGRLSFPIYLVHWPIMMTVGSLVYLLSGLRLPEAAAACLALCCGSAVTLPVAVAFERWIDAPAIQTSRRLMSLRDRPASSATFLASWR